jgi:hypothetical protein
MSEISGLIITPLWRAFMDVALAKIPPETFAEPPRTPDTVKPILRGVWFDVDELLLSEEDGEEDTKDAPLNIINAVQGAHDILYFLDKDDPRGNTPANFNDSQFSLWEYPVSLWKTSLLEKPQDE